MKRNFFLLLILLTFSFTPSFSQAVKRVSFNVDMSSTGLKFKDTILNVGVRGNIPPLMWVKGIKMADPEQDGIYSATVELDPSKEKELVFKYVLNEVEWEGGDVWSIKLDSKRAEVVTHTFRYVKRPPNPFSKFIGEWTLKEDLWRQGNGKQPEEQIKIPGHFTVCRALNTDNSLLWMVDATSARGHIMWVYSHEKKEVKHVSSFFPSRIGLGKGNITDNGDVYLKISFEGEPENTYRKYSYVWINDDEYVLNSVQYNSNDEPTGNFYGGTFIRINAKETVRKN